MKLLSGKKIALGLDWQYVEDPKVGRKSVPKGKFLFAIKTNGSQTVMAVSPSEKMDTTVMSGALVLAATGNPAIIFHPIEGGEYWVCAATDGMPIPGFDIICSSYAEALLKLDEANDILGSPAIYGDAPGSIGSIDDLLELHDQKTLNTCRLSKDNKHLIILVVGLIGVLIALTFTGYIIYKKKEEARIALELQLQAEEAARKAAEMKKNFDAHIAAVKQEFSTFVPMSNILPAWERVLNSIPPSAFGWEPKDLTCNTENCTIKWGRMKHTLPSSFTMLPGENPSVVGNEEASTTVTLEYSKEKMIGLSKDDIRTYLNDYAAIRPEFTYVDFAVVMSGLPAGMDPASMQEVAIGKEGTFVIRSKDLIDARAVIKNINLPGFYLKQMRVNPITRNGYDVELQGAYRVE